MTRVGTFLVLAGILTCVAVLPAVAADLDQDRDHTRLQDPTADRLLDRDRDRDRLLEPDRDRDRLFDRDQLKEQDQDRLKIDQDDSS